MVIALGLGARRYRAWLPEFIADYAGDTLWAAMVYLLVSFCCPSCRVSTRATVALAIAFAVEVSQLYHQPWIDQIRATTVGGLVLGHGFLWSDLLCYSTGIAVAAILELLLIRAAIVHGRQTSN